MFVDEKKPKAEPPPKVAFPKSDHAADPKEVHESGEFTYTAPFINCRYDPTGKFLFGSTQDFSIQRFELAAGKQTPLVGHQSWLRAMAFTSDGQTLITGGYDEKLIWWSAAAEQPAATRTVEKAHTGWVRSVDISPDGTLVATTGNDHLVKIWTIDGAPVRSLQGHACHTYHALFHPAGEFLVSTDLKGVVKQWEVATGKEVRELDASKLHKYDPTFRADIGGARSMAFAADGSCLAVSGITNVTNAFAGVGNPAVVLLDWETGRQARLLKTAKNLRGVAWGLNFHPAGFLIGVMGGNGGYLLFWKADADDEFHQLKLKQDARGVDLRPDGMQLAVAHFDNRLRTYDLSKAPAKKPAEKKP